MFFWKLFLALLLRLSELVNLQASCKKLSLLNELMDHSGNYVLSALPFILSLLQRGLGERINLLAHSLPQDPEVDSLPLTLVITSTCMYDQIGYFTNQSIPKRSVCKWFLQWPVDSAPPKHKDQPPLNIGLMLNLEQALSVLERGPPADNPKVTYPTFPVMSVYVSYGSVAVSKHPLCCWCFKADEFRQLWGSRSELRRFQDGSITEAVLWSGNSTCQRRFILLEIITHLLQLYVSILAFILLNLNTL